MCLRKKRSLNYIDDRIATFLDDANDNDVAEMHCIYNDYGRTDLQDKKKGDHAYSHFDFLEPARSKH